MIPLILRLKKTAHKEIAKAQDIIIETMYGIFNNAVLHGGTAIWRCYNGNRFSEDIDVYIHKDIKKLNQLFEFLEKKGFNIEKKRIKQNSLYSTLKLNKTIVRFEALFKRPNGSLKEYETSEGNLLTIYTLSPEELIKEKIAAYLKRLKVRDLYDIFFLLRYIQNTSKIKRELEILIKNFRKPIDENELKILLFEGHVPNVKEMRDYINRKL